MQEAPLVVPSDALCYRIDDPLLTEAFDFERAATDAAAAWGKRIIIDDRCPARFGAADYPRNEDGTQPLATHGMGDIVFHRPAILDGRIANMTESECNAEWDATGVAHRLLSRILTHELGHALGLDESEEQTDAMFWFSGSCLYIPPSERELAAVE